MANEINKCTVISGAPNDNTKYLSERVDTSSFIICADSGYLRLLKAGIEPNLILGDFDSSPKPNIDCEIVTLPVEKAYTDTFECVQLAVERGYNDITIFNAIGNRFDHTYSNVLILDYCRKNSVKCRICDEHNRLSLITDRAVIKKEYDNFSLFAYLEDCKNVRIKGAYYTAGFYNLDALNINQGDQFAQSNFISEEECEITLEKGTLLLVESND
jgi:thiamine pyrophosphokinase